jgi:hypothetical protein
MSRLFNGGQEPAILEQQISFSSPFLLSKSFCHVNTTTVVCLDAPALT